MRRDATGEAGWLLSDDEDKLVRGSFVRRHVANKGDHEASRWNAGPTYRKVG
jgi:hypothetical protein